MQKIQSEEVLKKLEEIEFLASPNTLQEKVILLIHTINLSNGLVCTGTLEDDPVAKYVLPPNWSIPVDGIYSFRYENKGEKSLSYYFKIINEANVDLLFVNAVSSTRQDIILSIEIPKVSSYNSKENLKSLIETYQNKIVLPLLKPVEKAAVENKKSSLLISPEPPSFWTRPRNNNEPSPFVPSFGDYGSSDLRPVPLGGGGGGSLLGPNNPIFAGRQDPNYNNPYNPNNNPFGGLPGIPMPGARFDPFGPGGINGSFSNFEGGMPKNPRFGGGGSNGFNGFI